jgi:tellurite resistance-related uncharacterized protein
LTYVVFNMQEIWKKRNLPQIVQNNFEISTVAFGVLCKVEYDVTH